MSLISIHVYQYHLIIAFTEKKLYVYFDMDGTDNAKERLDNIKTIKAPVAWSCQEEVKYIPNVWNKNNLGKLRQKKCRS